MTPEQQSDLWQTFHRFYKRRVKLYSPKIQAALRKQINQFINARNEGKTDAQALDRVTSGPMMDALKPLYKDAAVTYGAKHLAYLRRLKARMPIGFNEMMIRLVNRYFEVDLLNDVEDISQTTRNQIRDVLIKAYPLGWSFDEIVAELTSDKLTAYRARLIARTETNTAANAGAVIAARSTGLKMNKTWISAQDSRTRVIPEDQYDHLHMNGVTVPFDGKFTVPGLLGDEMMTHPGDMKASEGNRCNCRCTIGFTGVRGKDGRLVRDDQFAELV